MTSSDAVGEARIIVGVDTHKDEHVAVATDHVGARLGEHGFPTTSVGYEGLGCWARELGEVVAFGIEGTVPTTQDRLGTWPAEVAPSSRSADPIDPHGAGWVRATRSMPRWLPELSSLVSPRTLPSQASTRWR